MAKQISKFWTNKQIKMFVDNAKKPYGSGWGYMSVDQQEAVIFRQAYTNIMGQDRESIPTKMIDDLVQAMLAVAFPNREVL